MPDWAYKAVQDSLSPLVHEAYCMHTEALKNRGRPGQFPIAIPIALTADDQGLRRE